MSASPMERTPSRTPNGAGLPPIRRPKPQSDPLVRPRKRGQRPPPKPAGANGQARPPLSSNPASSSGGSQSQSNPSTSFRSRAFSPAFQAPLVGITDGAELTASGFSSEPIAPFTDYPLVLSRKDIMEGIRHHVAKFYSKKTIDPRNEEEFVRPVRLQRREPKQIARTEDVKDNEAEEEREKKEQERAEREAKREADMAQVAPSANKPNANRFGASKRKTQQVHQNYQTEEQKARSKLRYEETLQWHLEDFDNKQSWVGSYEAARSEVHAQLVLRDGKFYVCPVEKWYKFTPRMHIKDIALEDAEKEMQKSINAPSWLVKSQEEDEKKMIEERNRKFASRLFVGKAADEDTKSASLRRDANDVDELDFEEDRFADDEEPDVLEGEEEEMKTTQDRIKKDQLQANIFDMKDEKTYDKQELIEKKAKQVEKEHGKRVRKALMRRERNYIYDSDSENPYSEKSESTDSEAERQKEEEKKKEEEEKKKAQPGSGASTKGENTPSNRPGKHLSAAQKNALKRTSSANASETSGNESSRKKLKKKHASGTASSLATGANTPNGNTPRSQSPAGGAQQRKSSFIIKRPRAGAGSGSEGEGAGSGAEMSDGTKRRIKILKKSSKGLSPSGSRSPSVERGQPSGDGRRAVSPASGVSSPLPAITAQEIRNAIPDGGISIGDLFKKLQKGRISDDRKDQVFKLLKTVTQYDKASKLLKKL